MAFKVHGQQTAPAIATETKTKRPQAKHYINVGYYAPDPENPGEQIFIGIPLGIGLDNQEPDKSNTSNAAYAELVDAKNQLLESLQAYARECAASAEGQGHEEELVNLTVQLRIAKDSATPAAGKNRLANAAPKFGAPAAIAAE